MNFCFSDDVQDLIPVGFGSVSGGQGGSHIAELSTQAVMELIRNVSVPNDGEGEEEHVGIDVEDVENFFIDRQGSEGRQVLANGESKF